MTLQVIEIGLRQVKGATIESAGYDQLVVTGGPHVYADPDWARFEEWVEDRMPLHDGVERVGISTPGLLDPATGVVRMFPAAKWTDRPLEARLARVYGVPVHLLSDGEAHAHAHMSLFAKPLVALAFDSTIAFGWANADSHIVRPRADRNFDIGEWQIPTHADNTSLWWALGDEGFSELLELEKTEAGALRHWGFRLGRFISSLAAVLQPRTVVLSGSRIVLHWAQVEPPLRAAVTRHKPAWLEPPAIVQTPFGEESGLLGIASYLSKIAGSEGNPKWRSAVE